MQDVRQQRIHDACGQLVRYGHPFYDEIAEVLDLLTDINDHLWHSRMKELTVQNVEKIKGLLDKIVELQN